MDIYKKIKIAIGLLFLYFSYLQINDQDYIIWIFVYLLTSLCTFYSLFQKNNRHLRYLSVFYFLYSLVLIIGVPDDKVTMYIFSEKINEAAGLIICSIWIYYLTKHK